MEISDQVVAIVGLGLMGGSLAGALTGQCARIVGVARRADTVERALTAGWIDWGTCDVQTGIAHADIVVLATPVRTVLEQVDRIGPWLRDGALLMDLGSTKRAVVSAMEQLPPHVQPLGGHPMCGRERSGLDAADPGLYRGARFVLTPLTRTSSDALSRGEALVRATGASPLVLDADRHDRLVAMVSHLPYIVAAGLVGAAETLGREDHGVWALAASGFRDSTRLAASDVGMMADILATNRECVLDALALFRVRLDEIIGMLREPDGRLGEALTAARTRRQELFR